MPSLMLAVRMGCLDDLTITNLVGNALPEPARSAALAHLDECGACSELVAAMAVGSPRGDREAEHLAPGTEVGRYIVERVAGAGAMGVVYAARDPSLDRTVALKLVAATGDAHARDRMVREARAMAQLSHRNVVTIFDVGTHGDDVFLAMEFLPGRTLRQWLAERTRTTREIVRVLCEAGRGLAAAHDAGLVHRDIKPDNVLIADDGRVCITDFGLARTAGGGPATERPEGSAPATALTATGHLLGTPVYMAPEQLAGGAADVRSDQFSFCIVAYECLAGRRPFDGTTIAELRDAIAREPAAIPRAPKRLEQVIRRGLATDPDRRFASMTELIDALSRDPAVRYRRIALAGGALALVAGALFAFPRGHATCPDPRDRLAGTWDGARRAQLSRAFSGHAPFAAGMATRASDALDRYADAWVGVRVEACRATYERRDQSEARYDAELACLDRRRSELAAAVDLLTGSPDEDTIKNALAVVQGLSDVHACSDGATLSEQPPLPANPAVRMQLASVFRNVAAARALAKTSKFRAAQALIDELVPRARALGYAPALAEALYLHGKLQMATQDAATAERALNEAAKLAASMHDDALAARVWTQLAYTVGAIAQRFAESAQLANVARAAVQRAGDPPVLVIEWHDAVGAVLAEQGKYADALPHYRDALALAEKATGPAHAKLADQLSKLSVLLDATGDYAEARKISERAVALTEAELGPDHPDVALALDALGAILYDGGTYEDAQRAYRRSLAIWTKLGEADAYSATQALEGLGNTALALGQLDEARAQHEKVLAIRERTAPDDPHVADSLINLGMVLVAQGHVDEARASYDRALAIYRAAYGPDHPQVAVALRQRAQLEMGTRQAVTDLEAALAITTAALGAEHPEIGVEHGNLGAAYAGLRDWAKAEQHYRRAVELHDRTLGPEHAMTAMALTGLGQALVEQKRGTQAIAVLERALAIDETNHVPPSTSAVPRWFLVRALWETGTSRSRARTLARQAKAELADAADPTSTAVRAELDAWLAAHGN